MVQAGCFGLNGVPEIVVSTSSGKVFGLSTQSTVVTVHGAAYNESLEYVHRLDVETRTVDVDYMARSQDVLPKNVTGSMFDVKETVRDYKQK